MAKNIKFDRLSTDSTFDSNSDVLVPSQSAVAGALSSLTASTVLASASITSGTITYGIQGEEVVTTSTIETATINYGVQGEEVVTTSTIETATIAYGVIGEESVTTSTISSATIDYAVIGEIDNVTASIETANITVMSANTATITDLKTVNIADVATSTSSGETGQIVFGTSSIYVCTATDTWVKSNYDAW